MTYQPALVDPAWLPGFHLESTRVVSKTQFRERWVRDEPRAALRVDVWRQSDLDGVMSLCQALVPLWPPGRDGDLPFRQQEIGYGCWLIPGGCCLVFSVGLSVVKLTVTIPEVTERDEGQTLVSELALQLMEQVNLWEPDYGSIRPTAAPRSKEVRRAVSGPRRKSEVHAPGQPE